MEAKISKWSRILQWIMIFSLLWYIIGLSISLPQIFSPEEWTSEYAIQEIQDEIGKYIETAKSTIVLHEDAVSNYLLEKKNFTIKRLTEIGCDLILFIFVFVITRRLSKQALFDQTVCRLVRWIGIVVCISSFIIPSFGHVDTGIALIEGFGFDIFVDFYRLGCGVAFILLAYVLQHGQFLQEEYDTTL